MKTTRRQFIGTSAAASVALAGLANVHAQNNNDTIKIGLVGCGGRGSGAAEQCLRAGDNLKLVAVGDAFRDRAEGSLNNLKNNPAIGQKVDVPAERIFTGLDAYRQVIAAADLVIFATPPGFRPGHLAAAIEAGKHVFTEKPVAVDGPGVRKCLEVYEQANQKKLNIVAGLQRRYQTGYLESMKRIHDGDIGEILAARCYWNQGGLWHREKGQNMGDLEWQLRNWLYFTWLSGDHIVEQHVHNLDVINWAFRNGHPIRAVGMGGRQVRTGPVYGHIFDHFATDFEYPNGVHVMSMARQIDRNADNVSEAIVGSKGQWASGGYRITGEKPWTLPARTDNNPYQQEHVALIQSIRAGRQINDLKNTAESTLTAIMARMACYTGKAVTWEQALNSQEATMPARLSWDMNLPVPPVAVPGQTELR